MKRQRHRLKKPIGVSPVAAFRRWNHFPKQLTLPSWTFRVSSEVKISSPADTIKKRTDD
ncbi:hypothetical protein A33Q_0429 [Indibacter alkaliphilus LW1]|uniref:Uncharacterized protein n=1 Tax=Indibacter alkaliphilus (strain CCUG 57479 / KCTC 22604 / LW1) TaxID=1189612 RepID=S2EBJ4_INDAL|nr:hypothetical protein A33Q_0429 [Indibacter alkaliphilus LW1]